MKNMISKINAFKLIFFIFIFIFLFSIFGINKALASEPRFKLIDAVIVEKSANVDATIDNFDNNELNTNITFHNLDEFVKFKLTIKNTSDKDYKVKLISDDNSNNYITYTYDDYDNQTIQKDSTLDIVLTATYKNELLDINYREQENRFNLSFEFIDEEGNVVTEDIIVNPKTHDNINLYIASAIISFIVLISLFIKNKKTKYLLLVLVLIPVSIFAISPSIVVTITNELDLFDKVVVTYTDEDGQEIIEVIKYGEKMEKPEDPLKDGYNFIGWFIGDNEFNFDSDIITDKELTPKYELIEYDIVYDLDGGSVSSSNPLKYTIETDTFTLNNPTKDGSTFDGWTGTGIDTKSNNVTIEKGSFENRSYKAHWIIDKYIITYHSNGGGEFDNSYKDYDEQLGSLPNPTKDGYSFDGWYTEEGLVNKVSSTTKVTDNMNLYAKWTANKYTINFDGNESTSGSTDSVECTYDESCTLTLNGYKKMGYSFDGWAETIDGEVVFEDNSSVTNIVKSGTKVLYAKWSENPYICKKAVVLHTQECNKEKNEGCVLSGYTLDGNKHTTTITYGNVALDELSPGNAFNCDVNGDGVYDDDIERFYYLRTLNNKAVLIYNSSFSHDDEGNRVVDNSFIDLYSEASNNLPRSQEWPNIPLIEDSIVSRLPYEDDLLAACSNPSDLTDCNYILENTIYYTDDKTKGRSVRWLNANGTPKRYRGDTNDILPSKANTEKSGFRPVIEIPLAKMDDSIAVRFNTNGGEINVHGLIIKDGNSIGSLPTPVRNGYLFDGWFTSLSDNNAINENYVVNNNTELFAKWTGSIDGATLENNFLSVKIGNTVQINITKSLENNEEYIYTSNNEEVALVDSNGLITGVNEGITTITIKGAKSNSTKTVTINVNNGITYYIVSFVTNGGDPVDSIPVKENTAIGELPIANKNNNTLVGWYLDSSFTTKVTSDYIVSKDTPLYAKWRSNDVVAEVNGSYYTTLKSAFAAVKTKNTKYEILIWKDFEESNTLSINSDYIVELNMQGHTYNYTGTSNVFKSNGNFTIIGGTIKTSAGSGMIDISSTGVLTINSGNFIASGSRQVIYNNGGVVTINNNSYLTSSADERATVHNLKNGTIYINGGTIISTGNSVNTNYETPNAIRNESGTVYIGESGNGISTTNPIIQGNKNGVYGNNIYFYDGIIKGKEAAFSDVPNSSFLEANTTIQNGTEVIDNVTYQTAILIN